MRPILKDLTWPGRRVRPADAQTAAQGRPAQIPDEGQSPFTLVSPSQHGVVHGAFEDANTTLLQLEAETEKDLRDLLSISIGSLPQTAQSVQALSGTHSSFGNGRPAVPASEQLNDTALTYDHLIRALDTLDHGDRIAFGFDVTDIVSDRFDGTVETYGAIASPAAAAGRVRVPRSGQRATINEALEERLTMSKREMFWMAFLAIISFVVRMFGDVFKKIGDKVARLLSFKILGRRIRVGKFVAKPFWWVADLLYGLADDLEEEAMGLKPKVAAVPPATAPETPNQLFEVEEGVIETDPANPFDPGFDYADEGGVSTPDLDSARYDGSSGMYFLMHAHQVVRTVNTTAGQPGNEPLRDALTRFTAARRLRTALGGYHQISHAMGVASGLDQDVVFDLNRVHGLGTAQATTRTSAPAPAETTPADTNPAFDCD